MKKSKTNKYVLILNSGVEMLYRAHFLHNSLQNLHDSHLFENKLYKKDLIKPTPIISPCIWTYPLHRLVQINQSFLN